MTATQTTTQRPTWQELTHRQKLAAFCMNQDNFEQSRLKMADEWAEFLTCFEDGTELNEMWASLNRQAAGFAPGSLEWKGQMFVFLRCANR